MTSRVTVLLATYNGRRWLPEQLESILAQRDVDVQVIALDDGSTDGTAEWLAEQAAVESRLSVLPTESPSGSAAANFFRLIARAPIDDADYIALSDQDDLWMPRKLANQIDELTLHAVDGVSSSVVSFTAEGTRTLVRKNFPQREFDFLTESPGPGCTFLMTPRLVALTREVLASDPEAHGADFHDSLVYALARSHGLGWHIGGEPTLDYRQHGANVMGSNVGVTSAISRLSLIREHWHRNQAILHARVGLRIASERMTPGLERMLALMTTPGLRSRWALAAAAGQLRRRPRDRWVMRLLIAAGVW